MLKYFVSFVVILLAISCGQNHHITSEDLTSLLDNFIPGTSAGIATSVNVSSNDNINCSVSEYSVVTQNNVNISGTGPNYILNPIAPGPWDFTYSVTCSNGDTVDAVVSGVACEAQKFVFNALLPVPADQFYNPSGSSVTHIHVKAWGAGGGGGESPLYSYGGVGGYTEAILNSSSYLVVVAEAGKKSSTVRTYGGGGAGGFGGVGSASRVGNSAGGLSGLFNSVDFNTATQANSLVIAPGGGAGGIRGTTASGFGGAGGFVGQNGVANSFSASCNGTEVNGEGGFGATQIIAGLGGSNSTFPGGDGAALLGGSGFHAITSPIVYHGSGGGGAGYFGGGAGATGIHTLGANNACDAGGGGGSGFVSGSSVGGEVLSFINANTVPNSADSDYIAGIGASGENGPGGSGLVVIQELCAPVNTNNPFAFIDRVSTSINTPVNINAVANDVDVDIDLDTSSISIITNAPPAEGSCTLGAGPGEINFSPALAFTGKTSCVYQVCDSSGSRCDTATIEIQVL